MLTFDAGLVNLALDFFFLRVQTQLGGEKTPCEHISNHGAQAVRALRKMTALKNRRNYPSLVSSSTLSAEEIAFMATPPLSPSKLATMLIKTSSVASSAMTAETPRDLAAIS